MKWSAGTTPAAITAPRHHQLPESSAGTAPEKRRDCIRQFKTNGL
jgi:hypothetical protein